MKRRAAANVAAFVRNYAQGASEGASAGGAGPLGGLLASRGGRVAEAIRPTSPPRPLGKLMQQRGAVMPAATRTAVKPLPELVHMTKVEATHVDEFGAVSPASGESVQPGVFRNVDGHRFEDGRYAAFMQEISSFVPEARQFTDPVRTFAYGTDASFYRLNPKLVVKVHSEAEVARILPIAVKHGVPVTFRAAGTSLSGQALTDSVLLKLSHTGKNFRNYTVHDDGSSITVEPGLIAGEVNKILAAHKKKQGHEVQYKIGPDPSSIDSCMIGGVVANNSSGMCCGVSQNTYHTLRDMRVVLVDGTVLDTADPASREAFLKSHKPLVDKVLEIAARVQGERELTNLIRRKFSIKCTTGYSLNALVDFPLHDPIEIIKHLMIGSEGTLGFVSQATYNTVPDWPHKASAFIMFPDVYSACRGASVLRDETTVDAVEMFDRASLRECEANEDMTKVVPDMAGCDPMAAALLVECRGSDPEALQHNIEEVKRALARAGLPFGGFADKARNLDDYPFHPDGKESAAKLYWDVRKGLIPIVGAARETGTSMLIEDVACPVDKLADMTLDLVEMFKKYEYHDASCFGHALEGNLHLVFSQGFRTPDEVQRFANMMDEMCYIVATKHGGSLKGEHGTGRNMAPYVEMEWGSKAYELMWELKQLFDPNFVLNPGVVLNRDPDAHLKFLKPSPAASELVDRCIECGFCESNCPSRDLTLTPRQRITTYREMARLRALPSRSADENKRLQTFEQLYAYDGEGTCAADGMCQEKCPVKINTGELVKSIRAEHMKEQKAAGGLAMAIANNMAPVSTATRGLLNTVDLFHGLLGARPLELISTALNKATNHWVPTWNKYLPKGASPLNLHPPVPEQPQKGLPRKVVYMASCVTRMMGPARGDTETASVHEKLLSLMGKAGYEVVYPKGITNSCCGMLFNSRGLKDAASLKGSELEAALMEASEGGKLPIVVDTSPCLLQIKSQLSEPGLRFALYEPVEFVKHFLAKNLEFKKVRESVAVHVPCSSKKMGVADSFMWLAQQCAHEVTNTDIPCCGMAGDRGMRYPELTGSSLQHLNLPSSCTDGYSTSRTCEMSLSNHSGMHFRGLVYLLDEAAAPKQQQQSQTNA